MNRIIRNTAFIALVLFASSCTQGNSSVSRDSMESPYPLSIPVDSVPNFFDIDLIYSKPVSVENDEFSQIEAGDTYYIGSYEADGITEDGKETIAWTVLSKDSNSLFLISERTLDVRPYDTTSAKPTWRESSIRSYLNSTFYDDVFTDEEKEKLKTDDESDYVSLPSESQISSLLPTKADRKCLPTPYSRDRGSIATYWLKDITSDNAVQYVSYDGEIMSDGTKASDDTVSFRPVIIVTK